MPIDTRSTFNQALALHQRGDIAPAQALYREVLRQDPGHFDSLHLLGLTHVQQGDLARGIDLIGQAVAVRSDFAEAHYNLGNALLSAGRPAEALASLDRALALKPADPLYHMERSNALKELGRNGEALQCLEAAVRLAPRFAEAHNNIGILLKEEERFAEALAHYDRAISLRPGYAEAYSNRANVLRELSRPGEALASVDTALRLDPRNAEAHSHRGNVMARLKRHDEALASHDRAISLRPGHAEAHLNRGNALKELGRLDEALASFDRALALKPDYAGALTSRAATLEELGRLDEALAAHDKAVLLKPGSAEAWTARGNTLGNLDRLDEAIASYEQAIRLKPSFALPRFNKSLLALRQRDLATGFDLYRMRWDAEKPDSTQPRLDLPAWDGRPTDGEVLLWGEQGLGDEVFFASMLSLLEPGQKLALSADRRLHPALSRSFPGIRLLGREDTMEAVSGPYAAQAAMGDLGHLLGVDAHRLAARRMPYLAADPARREQIRSDTPFAPGRIVCGISWRSGNKKTGQHRSVSLTDLAPLLTLPGFSFVNLQYGDVEGEIADAADRLGSRVAIAPGVDTFSDIDGLLALIDRCDVVLTVANVTAHLAGALGKPAVVMVPAGRGRHWYWGGETESLWYPSLKLCYQDAAQDWAGPIAAAAHLLEGMAAAR